MVKGIFVEIQIIITDGSGIWGVGGGIVIIFQNCKIYSRSK
jgi:hypothetical protein